MIRVDGETSHSASDMVVMTFFFALILFFILDGILMIPPKL